MNNRFLKHLQITLVVLDLAVINLIFFLSRSFFRQRLGVSAPMEYAYFLYFMNLCWILTTWIGQVYTSKTIVNFETFSRRSKTAFLYFTGLVIIYLYFFHQTVISRTFIATQLVGIGCLLFANRFIFLLICQYFRNSAYLARKIVVIGYNPVAKKLVHYLENQSMNSRVIGFCEDQENVREVTNYPILANISGVLEECKRYGVTEIYSTIAPEQNDSLYELIRGAERSCIRFRLVPDLGSFMLKKQVYIDYLEDMPIISLRREPLEDLGNQIRRRIFDVIISLLVCIFVLTWMVPLIGLAILLESRGPVFFVQDRSGKNNQSFPCLKFRSMVNNSHSDMNQATRNDGRITRVGRFLRRTSLDEFPQFFNVLKGDMSIVGPRPHMLKHTSDYAERVDQFMIRQFVKPGITGWAQVNGYRGETRDIGQMEKRIEHDIWYLENWSLWLDVRIVFMTIYNLLRGEPNAF
ncbi:undecaprenyl-phosphate glucose phosphotransferase [Puia sp.]|jgi:putative colanic acid biosynthesis UDP-glucose lipid carrier transferase|uniref:undecaprenyl-phosphate glucose phosphotransferase n=1 Tax=Puia sp. TaxID=2045100 RepID=UPI002F3E4713